MGICISTEAFLLLSDQDAFFWRFSHSPRKFIPHRELSLRTIYRILEIQGFQRFRDFQTLSLYRILEIQRFRVSPRRGDTPEICSKKCLKSLTLQNFIVEKSLKISKSLKSLNPQNSIGGQSLKISKSLKSLNLQNSIGGQSPKISKSLKFYRGTKSQNL